MRQTLFHIPDELFGIPLVGNGLIFWGIVLFGIGWLIWTILRGKFNSDAVGFLAILTVGAFLTRFFLPKIIDESGFPIRGYGVMLLFAISLSVALLSWRAKKKWNIPTELLLSLVLWSVVFGLVGARVFHVVEYWPNYMKKTWFESIVAMLMYSEGGLVVYGSFFGGMLGATIFFIRNKLPVLATFDLVAPAIFLGLALGRIGCFLNGCCYGGICEPQYGVVFPPGSPAHDHQVTEQLVYIGGLKFKNPVHAVHAEGSFGCGCLSCKSKLPLKPEEEPNEPIVIKDVQSGSGAEKAGLRPEMTIHGIHTQRSDGTTFAYYGEEHGNFLERQLIHDLMLMSISAPDRPYTISVTEPGSSLEKIITFVPAPAEILPVAPTQLYSFAGGLFFCVLLLYLDRFCQRDGTMTLLFFLIYPLARFSIEMVRVDESSFLGTGFSISQNISLLILALLPFLAYYIFSRPPQHAYAGRFPLAADEKKTV